MYLNGEGGVGGKLYIRRIYNNQYNQYIIFVEYAK